MPGTLDVAVIYLPIICHTHLSVHPLTSSPHHQHKPGQGSMKQSSHLHQGPANLISCPSSWDSLSTTKHQAFLEPCQDTKKNHQTLFCLFIHLFDMGQCTGKHSTLTE
ncbi:hypothetical protein ILYODFUR_033746 [Ilyodon furcidens]|uniref:Uncharacterized protein n=1 Tax=Ilyodon furcidens TaxID=33524 RepID=A0ABV0TDB1_9TELE